MNEEFLSNITEMLDKTMAEEISGSGSVSNYIFKFFAAKLSTLLNAEIFLYKKT